MTKRIFLTMTLLGACAAFGEMPPDGQLTLGEVGVPVLNYSEGGYANPPGLFMDTASGVLTGDYRIKLSTPDEAWTLTSYSIGRTFSEQPKDFSVGDWCSKFPITLPGQNVNWAKTIASFIDPAGTNHAAYASGMVAVFDNAESSDRHIIFTRAGAVEIVFYPINESDFNPPVSKVYSIGTATGGRPYRLYATRREEGNTAAAIDLSGKYVRFFGDPALITPRYSTPAVAGGPSNVVWGLDYDAENTHALTARYIMIDEATHRYDCPQGSFVMAYYKTELKEEVVATIVVEIVPPSVSTIETEVGRELRPLGGGYDIAELHAAVNKGVGKDQTDSYSPYLATFSGGTNETTKVYGIAPTDVSTSTVGIDMPWKADVYWKAPDPMGTLWTFENDWYLIRWPEKSVKVVYSSDPADPGLKWLIPTNYVASATEYREPQTLKVGCDLATGEVQVGGKGRFVIKLTDQAASQVWYLPSESVSRTDGSVRSEGLVWPVGVEIRPQVGAAGSAAAAAAAVDGSLPGYIYERFSSGRNWNPRLYHYAQGVVGGIDPASIKEPTASGTPEKDPFSKLESAIYGVNASEHPIEVWWSGVYQDPDAALPTPVTYPCFVQTYLVNWERTMESGVLPQIVLASQRGSADDSGAMTMFAGKSLYLATRDAHADVSPSVQLDAPTNSVGFQLYTAIDGTDRSFAAGRVMTVTAGADVWTLSLAAVTPSNLTFIAEGGAASVTNVVGYGSWRPLAFRLPDSFAGRKATVSLGTGGTGGNQVFSAVGIVLDDLSLWRNEGKFEGDRYFMFDFADDDLVPNGRGERTARASAGLGTLSCNAVCASVEVGSARAYCGRFKVANDVTPEIYYQNDRAKPGYNPNEEHAFVDLNGDYVAWALRNDLNAPETSEPAVMVMYAENGKGRMQTFTVAKTSVEYPEMASSNVVGNVLLPPAPISRMAGAQTAIDEAASAFSFSDNAVAYRDRKNALWARRDGIAFAKYGYPMRDGFYFPSLAQQPAPGTPIAWLACEGKANPNLEQITSIADAVGWKWKVAWPSVVPELKIGQVLTKPVEGLPEMWNAASMAVCYPNPQIDPETMLPEAATVVELIDPTVRQTHDSASAPLPVNANFPDEYGFVLGASGTTFLRKGKYYFNGLPPSISDRFYVTVEEGQAVMTLVGQYVEKESGGSYLELNVLTDAERAAIKAICASEEKAAAWSAAADTLATAESMPSPRTNFGAAGAPTEVRKDVEFAFPNKDLYDLWLALVRGEDTGVATTPYVVDECAFGNLGGVFRVLCGKPNGSEAPNDVFAEWHETGVAQHVRLPSALAAAADVYAATRMNEFLGVEWDDAVFDDTIAKVTYVKGYFTWKAVEHPAANTYKPRDHYALVADGTGAGYVTLIENDNPDKTQVSEGLPVKMHVIKVVPKLYADGIAVLSDNLNKLSEKLTLLYRTPLGSAAKDFEFQWSYTTPQSDGTVPPKGQAPWQDKVRATGIVSVQLGETGMNLQDYVNTYYTLRYRPHEGTAAWNVISNALAEAGTYSEEAMWSAWAPEQLAEGWLQRVLNSLTPFAQRVEDFYSNPSDIWFTMLEQIGKPYQGDVALNNDNLTQVGLLELYQTVFNRAESLLVAGGGNNIDMSKQLILAQTRMGEFYSLLGAEAYADAKNPLISAGADGQQFASGTFSFANQVTSLLDEELALLRGRTASTAFPRMTEAPLYNRLAWNLTKGIGEGEPAYVANYGIRARDGVLDVNCAAAQYPQGHGDAWGHYLSALTGYYRLLRNPYFDWTTSMSEMLMDQKLMNVDYQDEQKFADAAVKLVQVGTDAMDLTLRKAYKENGGDVAAAYFDANAEQAFGYGEWATRTGMTAMYNWMTANALLPTNDAPYKAFVDRGVAKIDRSTATQLPVLASAVRALERKLGGFEAGANPLGLSENAIPFDIDPDRLALKSSHFEQILERAEKSLDNCRAVLGYANAYGSRLAQIAQDEEAALADRAVQEQAFNNQLIAIYGTPYSGDIGPGGTYPQGYDGPDIYNYTYMDLSPYGIYEPLQTLFTNTFTLVEGGLLGWDYMSVAKRDWEGNATGGVDYVEFPICYIVNEGGIRMKPETVTGSRRAEGTIQTAYRTYLNAYLKVQEALQVYGTKMLELQITWEDVKGQMLDFVTGKVSEFAMEKLKAALDTTELEAQIEAAKQALNTTEKTGETVSSAVPSVLGAGLAVTTDPRSIADAAKAAPTIMQEVTTSATIASLEASVAIRKKITSVIGTISSISEVLEAIDTKLQEYAGQMEKAADAVNEVVMPIPNLFAELSAAEAAYRAQVAKGEQIQEERALWRQQVSNNATEQRYLDMYNRVQRNLALTKYSTAFDTAQRYVWELAKVYDYETGLLSGDPQSGKQFLADIVTTRSLGAEGVSIDSATTDGGLYDVVNRLKANWDVLKPRLGVNNADKPAKWFSLRRELFRIKEGAEGDAAWRKELAKYRVDNILTNPDFMRHCQPPASANAVVFREPGYVIPFATSINDAENFFGKTLQFGDHQFSSADYATKIDAVGVDLVGLGELPGGADVEPNIYLVPVGLDYMRSPAGAERQLLSWNVVDQVLPLPYAVGSTQLDDPNWISTFSGLDGTSDSTATIRRHSTLRAGADFKSTRLVGRSAWNDRWIIVIPASAIDADRDKAMNLIESGVKDVRLGIRAYARQGN